MIDSVRPKNNTLLTVVDHNGHPLGLVYRVDCHGISNATYMAVVWGARPLAVLRASKREAVLTFSNLYYRSAV